MSSTFASVPLTAAAVDVLTARSVCRCTRVHACVLVAVSYPEHPILCRSSSTAAAPDVAAGSGSYDNSGGGAAWWQEWEPSASEARQQQQQQRQQQQQTPRRPRPWQPPADSDAQVLGTLTLQVIVGRASTATKI